jgi:hypothetical protein
MSVVPDTPETVEITNCAATKVELPGGAMVLSFIIPGIRRYNFVLDKAGRAIVRELLTPGVQTFGPNAMPRKPR